MQQYAYLGVCMERVYSWLCSKEEQSKVSYHGLHQIRANFAMMLQESASARANKRST